MAFIHKNINSGLLMLITFISVALVTATVYSVEAFDSLNAAYSEKAMEAEALAAELAQTATVQDALEQSKEREAVLARIMEEKQREAEESQAQTESASMTVTNTGSTERPVAKAPYRSGTAYQSPYRRAYWGWYPQKRYVI